MRAAIPAGVLLATLALAPFASAASDPLAAGTTTVTLSGGFVKALKKGGVKLLKLGPAAVKGTAVTLPVSGGSVDPLNGQGDVAHSGGIRFKAGEKSVSLQSLELNTTTGSLSAKIGGKGLEVATVKGFAFARDGFGVDLRVAKLMLTGKAAKELNKALAPALQKSKGKASNSKKKAAARDVFKANQMIGGSSSTTQPRTVAVLPGGNATLVTSQPTVTKLTRVGVKIETATPATMASAGPPAVFAFPIGGESIAPSATAGIVKTAGGLKLVQDLEALGSSGAGATTLTLGNIWVDLGARAASVEVSTENPKTPKDDPGSLGRGSIADVNLRGATITADPAAHTVSVQNASATLQAVTAEVLNSVFVTPFEEATRTPQEKFAAGDPLGTFSFTVQTE